MNKRIGVLCHVTCLPSKYGIGDFGESALQFIDFLSEQNINIWQILPLTDDNEYNCPYGSGSSFSIDEMFIDVDDLLKQGFITSKELSVLKTLKNTKKVNFKVVKQEKTKILDIAYSNAYKSIIEKLRTFAKQRPRAFGYSCYKALLREYNVDDWHKVPKVLWNKTSNEHLRFVKEHEIEIYRYIFAQYMLYKQWKQIRQYAKSKNVKIFGDLPVYLEETSFDVFDNPKVYKLDFNGHRAVSGGVPADEFSSVGQNWGTCVYNWEYLQENNYNYILERIKNALSMYDILRLDHYAGYVEHYEINKQGKGKFVCGGGADLFNTIKNVVGLDKIVIEDLGASTTNCQQVKKQFNLTGMNVLQFAFDGNKDNPYLPQNVSANSVYYLGTHDNNTFMGYLKRLSEQQKHTLSQFIPLGKTNKQTLINCVKAMINSPAKIIILQIQDFLFQGEEFRINIPGQAAGCWEYRVPQNYKKTFSSTLKVIKKQPLS